MEQYLEKNMRYVRFGIYRGFGISGLTRIHPNVNMAQLGWKEATLR